MQSQDTPIYHNYSDGDVIINEGDTSNSAYVVIKGQVCITQKVNGKVITVGTLKEREVFGEMGLISEAVRSANISAVGDVTVGVIDRKSFDTALSEISKGMKPIILALVERLRSTTLLLTRIGLELENTKENINSILSSKK
jgi:CRP/FNR family transcriptional regulator, cyclic AMP receptor protein